MGYRLGVDSGGTFTDVVLLDDTTGAIAITKTPSTPQDPSIGVFEGIRKIIGAEGLDPRDVTTLIHGTTVATNALLEYKGVETALICTSGFKDVLSIGRQDRPKLYDYFERRPDPIVPRRLRFEVKERVLYDGSVLEPLQEEEVLGVAQRLRQNGITAVAVCLLHSYANPVHEQKIKQLLNSHCPEAAVTLSWEVLPEMREYERTSTSVINAYVMPIIEGYLRELEGRTATAGLAVDLNVMQSNGGIMPAASASKRSVATILSGPAGGVLGSQWMAEMAGVRDLITFDIGGTSTDICLISGGSFMTTKESEIGGHAIKVPMIDINTIGAGGGSVAWIDPGGALQVGPQSAGADPGPACYDQGGTAPTVTDAHLVLGRLNPDFHVGGEMAIDVDRSRAAIRNTLASPLGLGLEEAAEGVLKVVNANMIRGIRRVSVERGFDPRRFSLMAFGGGGPVHAVEVAAELAIPRVLVPIAPGLNSAVGLLIADFSYDFSSTYLVRSSNVDLADLNARLRELQERAVAQMVAEKIGRDLITFRPTIEMRYLGQGYEIEIPLPAGELTPESMGRFVEGFHQTHAQLYGYSQPEEETEIVYLRLTAVGRVPKPSSARHPIEGEDAAAARKGTRPVYLDGSYSEAALYDRARLRAGNHIRGELDA